MTRVIAIAYDTDNLNADQYSYITLGSDLFSISSILRVEAGNRRVSVRGNDVMTKFNQIYILMTNSIVKIDW